jgi:hypothetical protein
MGRGKAWKSTEDVQVTKSWLNTSQDSIEGADQDGSQFWMKAGSDRNHSEIESSWREIEKCLSKFCDHFATIMALNEYEKTLEDQIQDALDFYQKIENKSFEIVEDNSKISCGKDDI